MLACSHIIFATACMLGFSLKCSLPRSGSIICILETKTDIETMFSIWQNWKMLDKQAHAMNVSGNMLSCFIETYAGKNSLQKAPMKVEGKLA